MAQAAALLRAEPDELVVAVERAGERAKAAEEELAKLRQSGLGELAAKLAADQPSGAIIARLDGYGADDLRQVAQEASAGSRDCVLVGEGPEGKPAIVVASGGSLDAKELVRELAAHIQGGGGGSPKVATAGGRDAAGLDAALAAAKERLGS